MPVGTWGAGARGLRAGSGVTRAGPGSACGRHGRCHRGMAAAV